MPWISNLFLALDMAHNRDQILCHITEDTKFSWFFMLFMNEDNTPFWTAPPAEVLMILSNQFSDQFVFTPFHMDRLAYLPTSYTSPLQWRHNERDSVSNHRRLHCLLNRLFRRRSKKTSKFRVTGVCEGNSPVSSEFPAQRDSNAENISIWWRHHTTSHYKVKTEWGFYRLLHFHKTQWRIYASVNLAPIGLDNILSFVRRQYII